MKTGRPEKYTEELAEKVLELISTTNRSLNSICKELSVGVTTVYKWIGENEDFAKDYARAKQEQADFLAEEIIEIADKELKTTETFEIIDNDEKVKSKSISTKDNVQRARLMIDSRKWLASKLKPKKYGEFKPEQEEDVNDSENTYENFIKQIKEA